MFAVIKTGGKQYRVEQGDVLEIEKLAVEAGKKVTFDEVLLVDNDGEALIGTPFVDKAQVKAVVLESFKDQKVVVFKKKRRKQYKRKTGHRQQLTRIKIEEILAGGKALTKEKPAVKPKPQTKTAVKPEPKAEVATEKKRAEPEKKIAAPEKPKKIPAEKSEKKTAAPKTRDKVKAETAEKPKPKAPAKKKAETKTGAKPKKKQ